MADDKTASVSPSRILEVAMGFQASKALLSAIELQLFTHLGGDKLSSEQLGAKAGVDKQGRLGLLLEALAALGFLMREGPGPSTRYSNTAETAKYLDRTSESYVGGLLEVVSGVPFTSWSHLTEVLRTGASPPEVRAAGETVFKGLYGNEGNLARFLTAMARSRQDDIDALTRAFDFGRYKTFCDVSGGSAELAIAVAQRHPGVTCVTVDLAPVLPIASRRIGAAGLADRVRPMAGDVFKDEFPRADVIAMENILCRWGVDQRKKLIEKVRTALSDNGAFIAIEGLVDDERRGSVRALLSSLNLMILTGGGSEFTGAEFGEWCREAGFRSTTVVPLTENASAAIAYM